ncbi:MAG TPA: hypothetical protein VNE40_02140 [Candidatus Dormibacteraeota bacterium]|nr:hypothetical protein [Candidatus Dormibacteraeota bacterium]
MMISRKEEKFNTSRKQAKQFLRSVWLFPTIITVLLLLLTVFQISGTSIGIYHSVLYGNTPDKNLLLNSPQPIRSDEWLVNTQLTIAQKVAGYPRVNPDVENGRDMSLVSDVPYKDWSEIFRPQNLAFFVLPFENAFAFKWWLLLYLVILGCYFFVLRLFPQKRLFSSLFSIAVGCSPFLFWWYETGTFAPIFYGFFIIILGMRIISKEPLPFLKNRRFFYTRLIYVLALSYLLACFALILYPPFQIPIALTIAFFVLGYLIKEFGPNKRLLSRSLLWQLGTFFVSILIAVLVVLAFVYTRSGAISAVTHTVYPGNRIAQGGGTPVFEIFSSYLQPQLERPIRAVNYYTNQSEASDFILFLPFLFLPGLMLLFAEYKKTTRVNWPLLGIELIAILFLADLFISNLQPLYNITFLDRVPHGRLIMGLGFAGILQLLLIVESLGRLKISTKLLHFVSMLYLIPCVLVLAWAGEYVRNHYPIFIHDWLLIAFLGLFFAAILFSFLTRRIIVGVILFLLFSLWSVFRINPLYHGLGPIYKSELTAAIDSVSRPGSTWVTLNNIYFENVAMISNRNSLSGVQPYPDLRFWRQIEGKQADYIYNRYAHVVFNSDPAFIKKVSLVQEDNFQVKFDCSQFIEKHVNYALSTSPVEDPCVSNVGEVHYPAITFYLYRVSDKFR